MCQTACDFDVGYNSEKLMATQILSKIIRANDCGCLSWIGPSYRGPLDMVARRNFRRGGGLS